MTTREERKAEADRAGKNLAAMAEAIGITPEDFFDAVKRQCVTGKPEDVARVTPADFVAFFHTARQFGLDPLRKELLIIPTKRGPRVYVPFDGWMRVLVSHPDYKAHGLRYNWADEKRTILESVTCWIARKTMAGTEYEISEHTEFMAECRVTDTDYTPWNKWPRRMLAEKAVMQAVRFTFAMYVPDLDDVMQAESGETAAADAAAAAPPAQGPIAPAAPIKGARKSKKPETNAVAALPEPQPSQTVTDFLRGKSEPVPVPAAAPASEPAKQLTIPESAPVTAPATMKSFDPRESLAVDAALAKADAAKAKGNADDFSDILD